MGVRLRDPAVRVAGMIEVEEVVVVQGEAEIGVPLTLSMFLPNKSAPGRAPILT